MFKAAVAHGANPLIIGPGLLRDLIERQQSQVAGIQSFMYSLKVSSGLSMDAGWIAHNLAVRLYVSLLFESSVGSSLGGEATS